MAPSCNKLSWLTTQASMPSSFTNFFTNSLSNGSPMIYFPFDFSTSATIDGLAYGKIA